MSNLDRLQYKKVGGCSNLEKVSGLFVVPSIDAENPINQIGAADMLGCKWMPIHPLIVAECVIQDMTLRIGLGEFV